MTVWVWSTPSSRLLSGALGVAFIAFLVAIAPLLFDQVSVSALPELPQVLAPSAPQQTSYAAFIEVTERPLFNSDRAPDPPLSTNQPVQQPLDGYRLAGIVTNGTSTIALVEQRSTAKVTKLMAGDNFDGRVVTEISPSRIVFGKSGMLEFPRPSSPAKSNNAQMHDGLTELKQRELGNVGTLGRGN